MKKVLFILLFLYGTVQAQTSYLCDRITFYSKPAGTEDYNYDGAIDKMTMLVIDNPMTYVELVTDKGVTRYTVVKSVNITGTIFYTVHNEKNGNWYDFTLTDIQGVFFNEEEGRDLMMAFRIKK